MGVPGAAGWLPTGVAAFLVCTLATPAHAANLKAEPSISMEVERNSNITNAPSNETYDYVFRASPRLSLKLEAFHSALTVSGGFDAERYAHHTEFDRNSSTKNFDLTASDPVQITPRFSVRPSARYVDSVDAVRRNQIAQSPTPGVAQSETLLTERTKTREYAGSLHLAYLLTPKMEAGIGGGGVKREFPEGPPTLIGSRTLSGNVSMALRLTPAFSSGFFFESSYNSFDSGPTSAIPNSRTYSGGLTGRYVLTERYVLDAWAGGTYLLNKTGVDDHSTHEWAPHARLSLTYASREFRVSLFGAYEIAGTGSAGRTTRRGTTTLSAGGQFLQGWWWDLSGSYQTNRSTDDAVTENVVTTDVRGGVRYELARWASVRLSGNLVRQWSHGTVGDHLKRHSLALGVTLNDIFNIL